MSAPNDTAQKTREELEAALGYQFKRRELLDAALTHCSYSNEMGGADYERLEFLGDSVVGLVTAHWLFEVHPDAPEGDLAKLKSFLVSTPSLSRRARDLGAGDLLLFGVGESRSGGGGKPSILADVLEALIGAVFVEAGLTEARRVLVPLLQKSLNERAEEIPLDSKTRLQEEVQGRGWALPVYQLVESVGPDHDKEFQVECRISGDRTGLGRGRSKKKAEQAAAAEVLRRLDAEGESTET